MAFDKEKLLALGRKNPIGISCGVVFLLLVGVAYSRLDSVDEAQQQLDAKSAEADRLANNIKHAAQLKEQLDTVTKAARELHENRLVRASELATNLQYFYKLEADTGVKLLELRQNLATKPKSGTFTPIPFSVGVQGDYQHLIEFLRRLENGSHFCRINSATLASSVASGSDDPASASLLTINLQIELLGLL